MELTTAKTERKTHKITLNGELWREVSASIFGKRCVLPPPCACIEDLESAFSKLEKERARRYVAFLLSKRDYSENSIRQKLKQKLVTLITIDTLLQELVEKGYLNDARYAERVIQSYREQGLGENAIKCKLLAKGLTPSYLEAHPPEDPLRSAKKAWGAISKRYNLEDPKGKQKAYAAMARRGFDWGTIEAICPN